MDNKYELRLKEYGLRLKNLREEKHYTQEELAKVLHTSRSRISMYEQGKRQPDFEMQETIADFFNVSIDYLFGRNILIETEQTLQDTTQDKALKFYSRYMKASRDVQQAIDLLLKASQ